MTLLISSDEHYVGGATLPLVSDYLLTGFSDAFAFRELGDGYTGAAIRLRRSDNTERDFTVTQIANGDAVSFCGSGSGFVSRLYSRTGHATLLQTTAAAQPTFVTNGALNLANGKPAVFFDGVDDFLQTTLSLTQPFSFAAAGGAPTPKGDFSYAFEGVSGGVALLPAHNSGKQLVFAGTAVGMAPSLPAAARFIYAAALNGASTVIFDTSGLEYDINVGAAGIGTIYVGRNSGSSFYDLKLNELIFYSSALSKAKLANGRRNLAQYLS